MALEPEPLTPDGIKRITDLLTDAFILLSDSGAILTANAAAHELFQTDQLADRALADLVTDPAPMVSDWLNRSSASRRMIATSLNLLTNGTCVPVGCEGGILQTADTINPPLILVRCMRKNEAPGCGFGRDLTAASAQFVVLPDEFTKRSKHPPAS